MRIGGAEIFQLKKGTAILVNQILVGPEIEGRHKSSITFKNSLIIDEGKNEKELD
jgi:hypothetical protein